MPSPVLYSSPSVAGVDGDPPIVVPPSLAGGDEIFGVLEAELFASTIPWAISWLTVFLVSKRS